MEVIFCFSTISADTQAGDLPDDDDILHLPDHLTLGIEDRLIDHFADKEFTEQWHSVLSIADSGGRNNERQSY
ncbi:MAG: hypothetical protein MZV70_59100 [Desulfobacterales bacterium]|nr:hypothetical protein [Desulfobacterales bacterium]